MKLKNKLLAYFTASDELSWLSHGLIAGSVAIIIKMLGWNTGAWLVPSVFYAIREIVNLYDWGLDKDAHRDTRSFKDKTRDGLLDFLSAFVYSGIVYGSVSAFWALTILVPLSILLWIGFDRALRKNDAQ